MSNSAYLLLKFDDKQKLPNAFEQLQDTSIFENYDAVDGHYHLLIKVVENSEQTLAMVKSFDGFSELSVCPIEQDHQKEFILNEEFRYCYVFIEADEKNRDAVKTKIESFDDTVFCSSTTGPYNLIALLKNETFDKIDRFVKTEIKNLDGVLRFKQDHVIFLDRI